MDLIDRLIKLGYKEEEAKELYLKYAVEDNLIDLEIEIEQMEHIQHRKYSM